MGDVSLKKIQEARSKIRALIPESPLKQSIYLSNRTGRQIALKLENLNISGSFKIRGAFNALLSLPKDQLSKGVVAASAGNHAQGVAYACKTMGIKATIFMPTRSSLVKAEATRNLGGDVRLIGDSYDEAFRAAVEHQKEKGGIFIHPFADANVVCGQGTIGLELLDQLPELAAVFVPIGGGGLISGIACALKETRPDIRIIGVQASAFPSMKKSFEAGKPVKTGPAYTIADGIAVKEPNEFTLKLIQKYVDDIILVEEPAIASAITDLMERDHLVAEGSGAVGVAAMLQTAAESWQSPADKPVAAIISGGNIDMNLLARITIDGQIFSGRMMRLTIDVKDRPGSLAELLELVGGTNANILEVRHNRHFTKTHYDMVKVELDLETIGPPHQRQVADSLQKRGYTFEIARV